MKKIHGFDGSCCPGRSGVLWANQITFSLGVFEILPKASGKGTKRGPVKVRVYGFVSDPDSVYAKAREIVDLLDRGEYTGPKTVRVGRGK